MIRAPRTAISAARIAAAVAVGVSATLACAAATTTTDVTATEIHPLTDVRPAEGAPIVPGADPLAASDGGSTDGGDNKYPGCPYGALEDPHRGFIRCLAPGEKSPFSPGSDAGAPGNADASSPSDGGPSDAGNG